MTQPTIGPPIRLGTPSDNATSRSPIPTPLAGGWYPDTTMANAQTTFANGSLYLIPLFLPAGPIDRLQIDVITAGSAGSVHRLGLYKQQQGQRLGSGDLVLDAGTVDSTTTGRKAVAVAQTADGGPYILAVVQQGAPATLAQLRQLYAANTTEWGGIPRVGGGFYNNLVSMRHTAGVTGALPATVTPMIEFASTPFAHVRYA